jgi:hypothetical protein
MSAPTQITAYDLEDKKALGDDILTEDDLSTHDGHGLVVSAPTEQVSPLGYHVDWLAVIFLVSSYPLDTWIFLDSEQNVSKMIGTGVFTTRALFDTLI